MHKSNLSLEKYWVTHSGYFILTTTAALDMRVTDGNLLLCNGVSDKTSENKIATIE